MSYRGLWALCYSHLRNEWYHFMLVSFLQAAHKYFHVSYCTYGLDSAGKIVSTAPNLFAPYLVSGSDIPNTVHKSLYDPITNFTFRHQRLLTNLFVNINDTK